MTSLNSSAVNNPLPDEEKQGNRQAYGGGLFLDSEEMPVVIGNDDRSTVPDLPSKLKNESPDNTNLDQEAETQNLQFAALDEELRKFSKRINFVTDGEQAPQPESAEKMAPPAHYNADNDEEIPPKSFQSEAFANTQISPTEIVGYSQTAPDSKRTYLTEEEIYIEENLPELDAENIKKAFKEKLRLNDVLLQRLQLVFTKLAEANPERQWDLQKWIEGDSALDMYLIMAANKTPNAELLSEVITRNFQLMEVEQDGRREKIRFYRNNQASGKLGKGGIGEVREGYVFQVVGSLQMRYGAIKTVHPEVLNEGVVLEELETMKAVEKAYSEDATRVANLLKPIALGKRWVKDEQGRKFLEETIITERIEPLPGLKEVSLFRIMKSLTPKQLAVVLIKCLAGIRQLSNLGRINFDIKPDNFFVGQNSEGNLICVMGDLNCKSDSHFRNHDADTGLHATRKYFSYMHYLMAVEIANKHTNPAYLEKAKDILHLGIFRQTLKEVKEMLEKQVNQNTANFTLALKKIIDKINAVDSLDESTWLTVEQVQAELEVIYEQFVALEGLQIDKQNEDSEELNPF